MNDKHNIIINYEFSEKNLAGRTSRFRCQSKLCWSQVQRRVIRGLGGFHRATAACVLQLPLLTLCREPQAQQ